MFDNHSAQPGDIITFSKTTTGRRHVGVVMGHVKPHHVRTNTYVVSVLMPDRPPTPREEATQMISAKDPLADKVIARTLSVCEEDIDYIERWDDWMERALPE
jgi:hypothetical protein